MAVQIRNPLPNVDCFEDAETGKRVISFYLKLTEEPSANWVNSFNHVTGSLSFKVEHYNGDRLKISLTSDQTADIIAACETVKAKVREANALVAEVDEKQRREKEDQQRKVAEIQNIKDAVTKTLSRWKA